MEKIDKRSKQWREMDESDKMTYLQWEEEQRRIKSANAGGSRPGAGRKSKSHELKIIEKLDEAIEIEDVLDVLSTLILQSGDLKAVELYFKYRIGTPKQSVDVTTNGESFNMPIINFFKTDNNDD